MILEAAVLCLALNIFHEARGEPVKGQIAVAQVTLNRAEWNKKNVCREVYRPYQFSWTLDPEKLEYRPARSSQEWQIAMRVAKMTLDGKVQDIANGATHYHALYVRPDWSRRLQVVTTIGQHRFYKAAT